MSLQLAMTLVPLIGVNVWHGVLLVLHDGPGRPRSISEYAAAKPRFLLGHRIAHIGASGLLALFAFTYLLPNHYTLEAALLLIGSLFDILEVVTLNKTSAARWSITEPYFTTAWLMAGSYLMYGLVISRTATVSPVLAGSVWLFFGLLFIAAARDRFRNFWIAQMWYFSLLALIIVVAHVALL